LVSLLFAFIAGGVFALLVAAPAAIVLYRQLEQLRELQVATINSTLVHRDEELVALRRRRDELERQIDTMHEQGYVVQPPPQHVVELPPEQPDELEPEIKQFLNGFEDPADAEDFAQHAAFVRSMNPALRGHGRKIVELITAEGGN
jgi:cell division protein FtsB